MITYLSQDETDRLAGRTGPGDLDRPARPRRCWSSPAETGLRVSELTSLRHRDVDLGTGAHVSCRARAGNSRITPLPRPTVAVLRSWLAERGGSPADPLFITRRGTPLSRDALERRVARYAAIAARRARRCRRSTSSPHVLRHSAAMRLLGAGVDVTVIALWLGHFSGDLKPSLDVSSGACGAVFCQTLCLSCVTWITAQHTGSRVPGEGFACRADRHARLLDRRR